MTPHFSIIGDVHGQYDLYIRTAAQSAHTLQLGDLGFEYVCMNKLDPDHHKFLPGNHDNYSTEETTEEYDSYKPLAKEGEQVFKFYKMPPHFLGNFGIYEIPDCEPRELSGRIFFVRGGYSIDKPMRTIGLDWWPHEEISHREARDIEKLYTKEKPDFVVTHDCPINIYPWVGATDVWHVSLTAQLLQRLWEIHKPKLWVFGHHHVDWSQDIDGTTFVCLGELSTLNFKKDLSIINP